MERLRRSREYEVAKAWGRTEDKMREKYVARLGKLRQYRDDLAKVNRVSMLIS